MSPEKHENYAVMDEPIKEANEPRVKIIGKKGPHDFDSGDSAFYSEYSEDSDLAIPGNTAFNQMQYAKKQKKAKAKAAEHKKKRK